LAGFTDTVDIFCSDTESVLLALKNITDDCLRQSRLADPNPVVVTDFCPFNDVVDDEGTAIIDRLLPFEFNMASVS
jgi:hypothetical protein